MALISREAAMVQLNLTDGDSPIDGLHAYIDEASDIVLDYVTHEDKNGWDEVSAPFLIQAAVKLVLQSLYDDGAQGNPLSPAVKDILRRYRQPSLA